MSAEQRPGGEPADGLEEILRRSLRRADEGFDYNGLVAGVHERAHRIRVRRTVTTLAAAAVLVPALVGTASLLPDALSSPDQIAPAEPDTVTVTEDDAGPVEENGRDEDTENDSEDTAEVPWQVSLPPAPDEVIDDNFSDDNDPTRVRHGEWQIPDARPTGIEFLDSFGAPMMLPEVQLAVPDWMDCDAHAHPDGLKPRTGVWWTYTDQATTSMWGRSVDIAVTGWEDGEAAMEGLRADTLFCGWFGTAEPAQWTGQAPDALIVAPVQRYLDDLETGLHPTDTYGTAAVVRAGDYLVAVSVDADSPEEATEVATEIADKTAANLEVLDPERAGG